MKKCKSCQTDINEKAKKCPNCQTDQRNWFARHKILSGLGIFILIAIIGSAADDDKTNTASKSTTTGDKVAATATPTPAPKFDAAAFYAKVENGQTKPQVTELAGKAADSCTESEIAGYGKTEYCNWNGSFGDNVIVSVIFTNDNVSSKSKTGF